MVIGVDASRAFVKEPAGPEYYSLNLIQSMAKADKSNQYILYLRPGQKPTFELPKNFKVKEIPLTHLWTQLGLGIETILSPPDLLFIPAHTLPIATRILRPRLPIVVTIHGLEGKFLPQSGKFLTHIYRNWSITWAIKLSTKLIAVSNDTKSDIIKSYGKLSEDIKVIHEGVDFGTFSSKNSKNSSSIRLKYKIPKKYLLFVGTVQPRKNLIRLIESVSQIPKISLVIAGKLGWLYGDILKAPKRFGIENRVQFIGRVQDNDLPGLYRGAQAFVLPSLTEGFGLPVLEAQAAGVPVIVSKRGALPEVAGKGAVLVDPVSTSDIKEKIELVLSDYRLRKQLTMEGTKNAKKHSWELAADKTVDLLTNVGQ